MVRNTPCSVVYPPLIPTLALGDYDIPLSQSDDAWRQFVSSINASLDKLELAFRPIRDQRTGHNIYSIVHVLNYLVKKPRSFSTLLQVNLKGDAIAQMATEYTPTEIAYFKAIVYPFPEMCPTLFLICMVRLSK